MLKKRLVPGSLLLSPTPYDNVFRTMTTDCDSLVFPVMNEAFGEQYTGNEEIIFAPNEHFIRLQDGVEEKRITDSSFTIRGNTSVKYLFDCERNLESTFLQRIFDYARQISSNDGKITDFNLHAPFPRCVVLYLCSGKNLPDDMSITMGLTNGIGLLDVKVLKIRQYSIKDIFKKKLYFFIPFFIFNYENRFGKMENDINELNMLLADYNHIWNLLNEAYEQKQLTAFVYRTIIEMSIKVLEAIAAKYSNVRKGVRSIMGGTVLDHEAKAILMEGMKKEKIEAAVNLLREGIDPQIICRCLGLTKMELFKIRVKAKMV